MSRLDDVTPEELRRALDEVEGKRPTQRLLAAIAYKNGVTQTELAEWHGVQRRTIYDWLTRLESGSLERAAVDAPRSGRPRKLSLEQRTRLSAALRNPPTAVGIDAQEWTPALVRTYVEKAFDVTYSRSSCRRLLNEASDE